MNADNIRQDSRDGVNAALDQFESTAEGMQDAFARGKEQLAELEEKAMETAKQAAASADRFVHEKPWQAIGIAAVVGLVAGLVIRRGK